MALVTQARGRLGFGRSSSVEKRVNWRYTLERNPQDELLGGERKEEQIHLSVLLVPRGLIYLLRWKSLGGSEVVAQDGVGKTKSLESHKEFIRGSQHAWGKPGEENKSAPVDHCTPSLNPLWFPLA